MNPTPNHLRQPALRPLLLALLLASTLSGLTACIPVVATGAAVGTTLAAIDRRSVGTQTEDEGIEWKIAGRFAEVLGDKAHINQTSFNRRVLLTGEVPTAAMKAEAERLAGSIGNVQGVWNELNVGYASSFSARSNDAFITSKVKARFLDANRFPTNLVKVVTEGGSVFLLGLVTQAEADAAVDIARTTAGVRKVVNVLEIITPAQARAMDPQAPKGRVAPVEPPAGG